MSGGLRRRRERFGDPAEQSGIGLIEILVALVLLSVGLLAAERMQIQSMRANRSAHYQSQAHLLANDMIDRMRTNAAGVIAGHYDGMLTSASAVDPGCATTSCDDAERALQDLYDWSARHHPLEGLAGFVPALPGTGDAAPVGSVTALDDDVYLVALAWSEPLDGVELRQSFSMRFTALVPQ